MDLGRDGLTDAQIRDALHGRSGKQTYRFRYELQRHGARVRDLNVTEGSVSLSRADAIQRSASITVYDESIDWLQYKVKIFMAIKVGDVWAEWPLGVYIPSTPTIVCEGISMQPRYTQTETDAPFWDANWPEIEKTTWREIDRGKRNMPQIGPETRKARVHYELDCYDETVILKEDAFVERYYIPAGTRYLTAVQAILVSAGIERVLLEKEIETQIPVDREWDVGTSKLTIVNTLLEEINYNPIYCDGDGNMVIAGYKDPSATGAGYTYAADMLSVILPQLSVTQDFYNVPNVFIAISSNPDAKQDYRAVYVNDNPLSPLSTVRRGRNIVSKPYKLDAVASQGELDAYIAKVAFEASRIYEEIEFTTALMPIHGSGDILELAHPAVNGIYQETAWEMELSASGSMTHTARRLMVT